MQSMESAAFANAQGRLLPELPIMNVGGAADRFKFVSTAR
jgi:hypothetical protein